MAQDDGGMALPGLNKGPKITEVTAPTASPQPSPSPSATITQPPTEPSPATLGADEEEEEEKEEEKEEKEEDDDPPPPPKPAPKLCAVCNTQPGKYKCPRPGCAMPYCSIPCHKSHKSNHPPDPPAPTSQPTPQTTAPNPSQQTNNDPYRILLDHAHVFQRLVKKYPSLPFVLDSIHSQTLPPPTPSSSTTTPSFLQNNNRKRKEPPWSKDVGLRKGASALKKARTDPTDRGDGVREFCDAVLYLLSLGEEEKGKGDGVGDGGPRPVAERAVKEVGEEVRREERRIVEGLLREEEGV
ncbi:hypothetical protein QC763_309120 [Podospora pseudopauciseta]|uniref:C2H2-type domain-containing protein n=1 Tax=Podospora pseudopauciseta TaxID=2093780 RepID=A0ABR0HH66_9PEZI|nr:hypothetical protein QC763_309120 [Podospora pseudopauciseta]